MAMITKIVTEMFGSSDCLSILQLLCNDDCQIDCLVRGIHGVYFPCAPFPSIRFLSAEADNTLV